MQLLRVWNVLNLQNLVFSFAIYHVFNKRQINQKGKQEWTFQRNWQHWVHKTKDKNHNTLCVGHHYAQDTGRRQKKTNKHNTICDGHHFTQTNTNNVNKKTAVLQTTGSFYVDIVTDITTRN